MIDILNSTLAMLKFVEIVAVTFIVILAVDLAYYNYQDHKAVQASDAIKAKHYETEMQQRLTDVKYWIVQIAVVKIYDAAKIREDRKAEIRRGKEESADGGFFEESWVHGFNTTGDLRYRGGHRYPTEEMAVLAKKMDARADSDIFKNTEEI